MMLKTWDLYKNGVRSSTARSLRNPISSEK
jgi:hypothetical protein